KANGSSAPGNVADMSKEKRPLVASALVVADFASSRKLIGAAVTPVLPLPPQPAAASGSSPRSAAPQRRSLITNVVGRAVAGLVIRSRDPGTAAPAPTPRATPQHAGDRRGARGTPSRDRWAS